LSGGFWAGLLGLALVVAVLFGIIAVFTGGAGRLRAREICQALDIGTDPRHTEGMRSKLVARGILSEPEAGLFALAAKPSVQRESP
jgi:hypothetical protein